MLDAPWSIRSSPKGRHLPTKCIYAAVTGSKGSEQLILTASVCMYIHACTMSCLVGSGSTVRETLAVVVALRKAIRKKEKKKVANSQ